MHRYFPPTSWLLPVIICLTFWSGVKSVSASRDILTVYTHDDFISPWGIGVGIKKTFEAKCRCEINWVSFETPQALLDKLVKEGKDTDADLALGLSSALMGMARHEGIFDAHGLDFTGLDLPGGWRDAVFVPYSFAYITMLYSNRRVRLPPNDLNVFTRLNDKVRIVLQNPHTSAGGMGFLLWTRMLYGDKAPEFWKNIAPRVTSVEADLDLALARLKNNQADFVLGYSTTPMYFSKVALREDIMALNMKHGHYMVMDVAAMTKASQKKSLAKRFLQFVVSEAFQEAVPTGGWVYPVDLGVSSMPLNMLRLPIPPRAFLMNEKEVEAHSAEWLAAWDLVFSHKTVSLDEWDQAFDEAQAALKAERLLLQTEETSKTVQ